MNKYMKQHIWPLGPLRFIRPHDESPLYKYMFIKSVLLLFQIFFRQYLKEQLMAKTTGPEVLEEQKRKAEEHHANCIKINDLWNEGVAKIREARLAKEDAEREERIAQKMIDQDRMQKQLLDELDSHIRKEKVSSPGLLFTVMS